MHCNFFYSFVVIDQCKKSQKGQVIHDKRHACYFCEKLITNIGRHYETSHATEPEVAALLIYPPKNRKRKQLLDKLRLKGDYHHNIKCLQTGRGSLVVVRRPSDVGKIRPEDFLPCKYCLAFVQRTELWRHIKSCSSRMDSERSTMCFKRHQKEARLLIAPILYSNTSVSPALSQVFAQMVRDEITTVAQNDQLIVTIGDLMANKLQKHNAYYISNKMRQLAKLLIRLRKSDNNVDYTLEKFIKPDKFDEVVAAVLAECKYEPATDQCQSSINIPSLALKLGHSLKKCATLVRGKGLRERDAVVTSDAENFLELLEAEWADRVSSLALRTLYLEKQSRPVLLPLSSDLMKLRVYQTSRLEILTKKIQVDPTVCNCSIVRSA